MTENKSSVWTGEINGLTAEIAKVQLEFMAPWYCGYLDLPDGHPWISKEYNVDADVHGGITYNEGNRVGFDCGHSGDNITKYNIDYVKSELHSLSEQAIAAMPS